MSKKTPQTPKITKVKKLAGSSKGLKAQAGGVVAPQDITPDVSLAVFDSTADAVNRSYSINNTSTYAESFTTPGGQSVLTDLKFDLGESTLLSGISVIASLYTDNGTAPGTLISNVGTIPASSLSTTPAIIDVPVSGGPTLTAGTRYWIELHTSTLPLGTVSWEATNSSAGTGVSGEFIDANGTIATNGPTQGTFIEAVTVNTCYAAGTHILTDQGDKAVESLKPGDRVVALRRGGLAAIQWIGRRDVDLRRHPDPLAISPVRVLAGAFAAGVPHRDLLLSPDHAVFVDGRLVAIRHLLNGATIVQELVAQISYFHVELDAHDIVLAEGLAAETYLDIGNRAAFQNGGDKVMMHADFGFADQARLLWDEKACAPSLHDPADRAALHQVLLDRALACGHVLTADPDLYGLASSTPIRPDLHDGFTVFHLPAGVSRVLLRSRSTIPAALGLSGADGRRLGIGVTSLLLDEREIALDDRVFGAGWHAPETGLRWTSGAAWLETSGCRTMAMRLHPGLTYWGERAEPVDVEVSQRLLIA